jgi:hypothetical protein
MHPELSSVSEFSPVMEMSNSWDLFNLRFETNDDIDHSFGHTFDGQS